MAKITAGATALLQTLTLFTLCFASSLHAQTHILFLGDSLTAGYGIEQTEAFPAIVKQLAEQEGTPVSITNGGMSGDTTAGALTRVGWLLKKKPDVAFVALGANDGLRGLPVNQMKENLLAIIDRIRESSPGVRIILAGMRLPANFGHEYRSSFEAVYAEVAAAKNVPLMPFLLEGVATDARLNLPDRLHPSPEGHKVIADAVWKVLKPVIQS